MLKPAPSEKLFQILFSVSKVTFLCLPYQHCERGNQEKKGENGKVEDAENNKSGGMCDPSQSAEVDKWEQACTQEKPSNMADPGPDSGRGSGDSENSWFLCRTDLDMAELHSNTSSSGTAQLSIKAVFCGTWQVPKCEANTSWSPPVGWLQSRS